MCGLYHFASNRTSVDLLLYKEMIKGVNNIYAHESYLC